MEKESSKSHLLRNIWHLVEIIHGGYRSRAMIALSGGVWEGKNTGSNSAANCGVDHFYHESSRHNNQINHD